MNRKENLFINTIQNENCFTELFTNLLKFDDFRFNFLSLIITDEEIIENIQLDHFSTQKNLGLYGQPDIFLENDDLTILFEIKVYRNTPLTDNQPNGYINYLKSRNCSNNNNLIFIIPENYAHKNKLTENQIKIITWSTIIDMIENLQKNNCWNENCIPDIFRIEYLGFIKDWFSVITFNLKTLQMMNCKDIPITIENFYALIDKVKQELPQLNPELQLSNSLSKNDYGISIKVNDCTIYFGLWFYFWKTTGFPLSISINSPNNLESYNETNINKYLTTKGLSNLKIIQNKEVKGRKWYSINVPDKILIDTDNVNIICSLLIDLEKTIKSNI
jgi:hypothetical protein